MTFFSVIMPLYNKAPYVRKAVGSVVGQTFTNWELLVVDDGSSDGSAAVAEQFVDSRIRVVRLAENGGVSAARNRGVKDSSGQYLCFLDADDWWEPTFLEEMAGLITRHHNAGIYGTNYYIVRKGENRKAPIGVDNDFTEGEINYCQVYSRTFCMPLWTGAVCIPRAILDSVGGFNNKLRMAEDYDLWIRIALRNNVVLLNTPLSYYNQDVDLKTRAIGSLQPPEVHFAFNADYLRPFMEKDKIVKHNVEQVLIVCLKQYYLSREYHQLAKSELKKIDLKEHYGTSYSAYCRLPRWLTILNINIHRIFSRVL